MRVVALEHVQLAMPEGGEARAKAFYGELLGLNEVEKPANLGKRRGCWFESQEIKVHLGVETDFRPARKAHPAFLVRDLARLVERLARAGIAARRAARRL